MANRTSIKKSQPDEGTVYFSPELAGMAATFLQDDDDFVFQWFFPSVSVEQKTGKFKSWTRSHFARSQMQPLADGNRSAGAGIETEDKDFNCDTYGLHTKIGRQVRANAKLVDIDQAAMAFLTEQAKLSAEIQFFGEFFLAGVWGTDLTGVASGVGAGEFLSFADATARPLTTLKEVIRTGRTAGGKRFNKMVIDEETWDVLSEHPNVVSKIVTGAPGSFAEVTTDAIARYLRLSGGIRIAGAVKTTSEEGATATYGRIAGNGILLGHVTDNPSTVAPSAGHTYHWKNFLDGAANQFGAAARNWYEVGPDAWFHEIKQARDMKVVHQGMGAFLASPLAT